MQPASRVNSTMKVHMRAKLVSFRKKGHSSVILLHVYACFFVVEDTRARCRGWHRTFVWSIVYAYWHWIIHGLLYSTLNKKKWRFRTPQWAWKAMEPARLKKSCREWASVEAAVSRAQRPLVTRNSRRTSTAKGRTAPALSRGLPPASCLTCAAMKWRRGIHRFAPEDRTGPPCTVVRLVTRR
jgi:hypothetical protein